MKYTVRKGDTLSSIAEDHPGLEGGWKDIWESNRETIGKDPDLIKPGTVLEVPFGLKAWAKNLLKPKVY